MKQKGYLTLVAVVLIVIFGLLSAALVHLFVSGTESAEHMQGSHKALVLALSGLEDGQLQLRDPNLSNRKTCAGLNVTHTLGDGGYTTTGVSNLAESVLTSAVTASSTTLPVSNSQVFATQGRVIIDRESIDYAYNDTATHTLRVLTRGADHTLPSSHALGKTATQFQCTITALGSSPLTAAEGQMQLRSGAQLQEIWVVGESTFMQWNQPSANQWNANNATQADDMYAVSFSDYATGWAVGDGGKVYRFTQTTGSWTGDISGGSDFNGVSTVSGLEAWLVGDSYALYKWTPGPGWQSASLSGSVILRAIDMIDRTGDGLADFGFAVGNGARILYYDGSTWSNTAYPAPSGVGILRSVQVISNGSYVPKEAWACGNSGYILQWTPTSPGWIVFLKAGGQRWNAISMIDSDNDGDADFGWVVGNSEAMYQYNNGIWTPYTGSFTGTPSFNAVIVLSPTDAWAVSDNNSGNNRYHWDGVTWSVVTTGLSVSQNLKGISAVAPKTVPQAGWWVETE